MPPRKPKKPAPVRKQPDATAALRQALSRRTKADLVAALLELAQADRRVLRQLTARFDVVAAPDELEAAIRRAIGRILTEIQESGGSVSDCKSSTSD